MTLIAIVNRQQGLDTRNGKTLSQFLQKSLQLPFSLRLVVPVCSPRCTLVDHLLVLIFFSDIPARNMHEARSSDRVHNFTATAKAWKTLGFCLGTIDDAFICNWK